MKYQKYMNRRLGIRLKEELGSLESQVKRSCKKSLCFDKKIKRKLVVSSTGVKDKKEGSKPRKKARERLQSVRQLP